MCVFDIERVVDALLDEDYARMFPFGECQCGASLEENGECVACIQQAIDEKAMEAAQDRQAA